MHGMGVLLLVTVCHSTVLPPPCWEITSCKRLQDQKYAQDIRITAPDRVFPSFAEVHAGWVQAGSSSAGVVWRMKIQTRSQIFNMNKNNCLDLRLCLGLLLFKN